ncbi:MAG: hypothetical protein ACOCXV_02975 [Bacteroidota bacterium]
MIIVKILGGILSLAIGILLFIYNRKESKKIDKGITDREYVSYLNEKSTAFSGYMFSLVLICTGIGLLLSAFS